MCSLFSPPASNPWARTDLVQEKLISVLFSRQDTLSRKLCVLFWRICCYRNEIPLTLLLLSAQVEHQTSRKSLRLLSVSRCSVSGKLPARCQAGWSTHSFRSHPYGHSAGPGFGVCTTGHARNALGRFSKRQLSDVFSIKVGEALSNFGFRYRSPHRNQRRLPGVAPAKMTLHLFAAFSRFPDYFPCIPHRFSETSHRVLLPSS